MHWRRVLKFRIFADLKKLNILRGESSSNNCSLLIQQNQVYAEKSFPRRTTSSSHWAGKKKHSCPEIQSLPNQLLCDGGQQLRNLCCTLPSTVSLWELQPQPSLFRILALMIASRKPVNGHHFPLACGKFYEYQKDMQMRYAPLRG